MLYCENCGKPINETSKFCRYCGAPQTPTSETAPAPRVVPTPVSTVQPKPQTPQEAPEQIQSFIIVNRSKHFVRQEYLTGILTSRRLIFAPMTSHMIKEVSNISKQQAKGKTPPNSIYPYQQNYLATAPQIILGQSPDSFALENVSIKEIKLTLVSVGGEGYADSEEFELKVVADSGSYTFRLTKRDEYVSRLKQVYQDKVKLPQNYVMR